MNTRSNVGSRRLAVIGLGYVGLPVAAAFARAGFNVLGFDIDPIRVAELRKGIDHTNEVEPAELLVASLRFTDDPAELGAADFFIVTVPTPIDAARRPDLSALLKASETVGRALKQRRFRRLRVHGLSRRHGGGLRARSRTRLRPEGGS